MPYSSLAYRGMSTITTDTATYNFTSCNIGTESGLRAVLVVVACDPLSGSTTTGMTTTVTVNGVSATRLLFTVVSSARYLQTFIARVQSGTSVTIAVSHSQNMSRCAIAWYTFKPDSLVPMDTLTLASSASDVTFSDIDMVNNGVAFYFSYGSGTTNSYTYTGVDSWTVDQALTSVESTSQYLYAMSLQPSETVSTNDLLFTVSGNRAYHILSFGIEGKLYETVADTASLSEALPVQWSLSTTASDTASVIDSARYRDPLSIEDSLADAVQFDSVINATFPVELTGVNVYFEDFTAAPEFLTAADVFTFEVRPYLSPGLTVTDTINGADTTFYVYRRGAILTDPVNVAEQLATKRNSVALVLERGGLRETCIVAIPLTVSESFQISYALTAVRAISVIDGLRLTDTLLGSASYRVTSAEHIRVTDTLRRFFGGDIVESLAIQESVSRLRLATASAAENLRVTDAVSNQLVVRVVADERLNISETWVLRMLLRPVVADGVELAAAFIDPGGGITTWAVNTKTAAVTEYTNFDFNSFVQMGHRYFGASSSGLYALDGDTDQGTDIISTIKSGFAQFGGSRFTSFKAAYLGMRGSGDFVLRLETGDGKTYNYAVVGKSMETTKVHFGKGLRARYFAFELVSTGQDFDLDDIEFVPLVTQRRV